MPDVNDPRPGDVFLSPNNEMRATVRYVADDCVLLQFDRGQYILEKPKMSAGWKVPPPPKVLRAGDCYWFDGERLVPMGSLECIKGHLSGHESPALKDHLEPGSYVIQVDPRVHATHSYSLTPLSRDDDEGWDDEGWDDDDEFHCGVSDCDLT